MTNKVCNARFGEVLKNYCERNALKGKGKINFRTDILAMSAKPNACATASTSAKATAAATTAVTTTTAPVATSFSFAILAPGVNGAVTANFLKDMVFVLAGAFEEVNSNNLTANTAIKSMIESFGGKANARYSKNTSEWHASFTSCLNLHYAFTHSHSICNLLWTTAHLLAGKNTDGGKIKDAGKRLGVEIIDLRRLEKLLLGKLTLIELNQLDKLTRDHFKGNAYKPAGAPPSAETTTNAVSNEALNATATNASSTNVSAN